VPQLEEWRLQGTGLTPHTAYSIIQEPQNPVLYTNRAMARLKLKMWDSVIEDCNTCLKLGGANNMKANYYLAQAELELKDYDQALEHALLAHKLCTESGDKSLAAITTEVLRCKKERWEDREKRRKRQGSELEAETLELMDREKSQSLKSIEDEGDRREIEAEWDTKISQMTQIFEKARDADQRRREVPDWVIDDISFSIMVDPVIVSTSSSG